MDRTLNKDKWLVSVIGKVKHVSFSYILEVPLPKF